MSRATLWCAVPDLPDAATAAQWHARAMGATEFAIAQPDQHHRRALDEHQPLGAAARLVEARWARACTSSARSGVRVSLALPCARASATALATAAGAAMVPPSPRPLIPSGFRGVGVW